VQPLSRWLRVVFSRVDRKHLSPHCFHVPERPEGLRRAARTTPTLLWLAATLAGELPATLFKSLSLQRASHAVWHA
jgi:hypothetical protein